tara:strand:+ start:70 stop:303 length:234 start_codon:yes stop_codon:yes gene_type:complete
MKVNTVLGLLALGVIIKIFLDNQKPKDPQKANLISGGIPIGSAQNPQSTTVTNSKPSLSTRKTIQGPTTSNSSYTGY